MSLDLIDKLNRTINTIMDRFLDANMKPCITEVRMHREEAEEMNRLNPKPPPLRICVGKNSLEPILDSSLKPGYMAFSLTLFVNWGEATK